MSRYAVKSFVKTDFPAPCGASPAASAWPQSSSRRTPAPAASFLPSAWTRRCSCTCRPFWWTRCRPQSTTSYLQGRRKKVELNYRANASLRPNMTESFSIDVSMFLDANVCFSIISIICICRFLFADQTKFSLDVRTASEKHSPPHFPTSQLKSRGHSNTSFFSFLNSTEQLVVSCSPFSNFKANP